MLRKLDKALAGKDFRKYRAIIRLYDDDDGSFKPTLKVYTYFSNVLRAMRTGIFDDVDYNKAEPKQNK